MILELSSFELFFYLTIYFQIFNIGLHVNEIWKLSFEIVTNKVKIDRCHGEESLFERDTIENAS